MGNITATETTLYDNLAYENGKVQEGATGVGTIISKTDSVNTANTTAASTASSAASLASVAGSQASSMGNSAVRFQLAWSVAASVVTQGSSLASGGSAAKSAYATEGGGLSVIFSLLTSKGI